MLKKPLSYYFMVATIILFAIQLIPFAGIFLGIIGTQYLCGALLVAFMTTLFFEAIAGKVPRLMVLVPILAFGYYYALFFNQYFEIQQFEIDSHKNKQTATYALDSEKEQLISNNAVKIVSSYKIPVVFSNHYNGFRSHRLLTYDSCSQVKSENASTGFWKSNLIHRGPATPSNRFGKRYVRQGICKVSMQENPTKKAISVGNEVKKHGTGKASITEHIHTLKSGDKTLAKLHTAFVFKYSQIPLPIIFCVIPAGCEFELYKSPYKLNMNPNVSEHERDFIPEVVLLGLEKYSEEDFAAFQEYPEGTAAIAKALKKR